MSQYLAGFSETATPTALNLKSLIKSKSEKAVRKTFLKTDSIGSLLYFNFRLDCIVTRRCRIKLENRHPAASGSSFETAYLMFPRPEPLTIRPWNLGLH